MKRPLLLILIVLILLSHSSLASIYDVNHLPLLAVQELPDGNYSGNTADLFLEVRDGSGRVFLDTSPLTKIDTQISTRYAKEIACDYFDLDCEKYDFIYTIRAKSNIIGGPSAGAAISALTAVTLLDLDYNDNVAITGTINSGGMVGPVGGVKEKIIAAEKEGLDSVLVSLGSFQRAFMEDESVYVDLENSSSNSSDYNVSNSITTAIIVDSSEDQNLTNNKSFDKSPFDNFQDADFSHNPNVNVVEVSDLNDILFQLTGKSIKPIESNFEVDETYNEIMMELEGILCDRANDLHDKINPLIYTSDLNSTERELIFNNINESKSASESSRLVGDYYSSASFCFGLNVYIQTEIFRLKNFSISEKNKEVNIIKKSIISARELVDKETLTTISDLQTKMVVKERIREAEEFLDEALDKNNEENFDYLLAYSKERLYSSLSWMHFFQMDGKQFLLDDKTLSDVCYQKIAEDEESYQYVNTFLPMLDISYIQEKIDIAKSSLEQKDYELCLMKASQAKAEISSIMSSMGITPDNYNSSIVSKLNTVERIISENVKDGIFPILGYSYYQYGNTLSQRDQSYSALVFLEYSLELSDLDIYFPEKESNFSFNFVKDLSTFMSGFLQGLIIGCLLTWLIVQGFFRNRKSIIPNKKRKS